MDEDELTVELFQGELLGLADKAENHAPGNEVKTGIKADYRTELAEAQIEGNGLYVQAPVEVMTVLMRGKVKPRTPATNVSVVYITHDSQLTESVVNAHGPGHALLTLNGGEDFGRVLEGNGAFAEGIADGKEVDEKSNWANLGTLRSTVRLEERKTTGQQKDAHEGECLKELAERHYWQRMYQTYNQAQSSASLGVNQEKSGNGEDDLNGTVAERGIEGLFISVTGIGKNGGAVEGNDCRG